MLIEMMNIIEDFCKQRDWDQFHNPKDLAIGISTEAAELLDFFRFKNAEEIEELMIVKKDQIEAELMDVLYFVLRFAQMNQIDIIEAFKKKMALNNEHYPVAKVKGKNQKYNEY